MAPWETRDGSIADPPDPLLPFFPPPATAWHCRAAGVSLRNYRFSSAATNPPVPEPGHNSTAVGTFNSHSPGHATAPFALIQDAELNHNPADYPRTVEPLVSGTADVVSGTRCGAGACPETSL